MNDLNYHRLFTAKNTVLHVERAGYKRCPRGTLDFVSSDCWTFYNRSETRSTNFLCVSIEPRTVSKKPIPPMRLLKKKELNVEHNRTFSDNPFVILT